MADVMFTKWKHEPPKGFGSWIIYHGDIGLPAIVDGEDEVAIAIQGEVTGRLDYEEQTGYTVEYYNWKRKDEDDNHEIALYSLRADHPIYGTPTFMPNANISSGIYNGVDYGPWIEHVVPSSDEYPNTGFTSMDDRVRIVLRDGWESSGRVGDYTWGELGDETIARFAYEIHHSYYDTIPDIAAQRQEETAALEANPLFGMF